MVNLDAGERRLRASVDRGDWRPVRDAARRIAHYRRLASVHLKKEARINIRLTKDDLAGLRRLAMDEGLPYQTLISSLLHKYISGRLVERERQAER